MTKITEILDKYIEKYEKNKKRLKMIKSIMTTIISILTIVALVWSNILLAKTNEIYTYQSEISRLQVIPEINVYTQTRSYDDEYLTSEEEIVIENNGGAVEKFQSSVVTFYDAEYSFNEGAIKKEVALKNYYSQGVQHVSKKGILDNRRGTDNLKNYIDFSKELSKYEDNKEGTIYIQPITYVKINYTDRLGDEYEEYYRIQSHKGYQIDSIEGEKIFKQYDLDIENGDFIDAYSQSIDKLYEILNKN